MAPYLSEDGKDKLVSEINKRLKNNYPSGIRSVAINTFIRIFAYLNTQGQDNLALNVADILKEGSNPLLQWNAARALNMIIPYSATSTKIALLGRFSAASGEITSHRDFQNALNYLLRDKTIPVEHKKDGRTKNMLKNMLLKVIQETGENLVDSRALAANSLYLLAQYSADPSLIEETLKVLNTGISEEFRLGDKTGASFDKQREIFRKYGVVIFNRGENEWNFSDGELDMIAKALSHLPQHLLQGTTAIITGRYSPEYLGTANRYGVISIEYGGLLGDSRDGINRFVRTLYHEIGHTIQLRLLSPQDYATFLELHKKSISRGGRFFARDYGRENELEDFATLFEAYATNTRAIVDLARALGRDNPLMQKLRMIVNLFKFSEGNKEYSYIYEVDADGNFKYVDPQNKTLPKRELGPDGLPVF
jgi:hypothetical protein